MRVGLGEKRRKESADLLGLFFLIAFLHGAEHPLRHGLVADAELEGGIQDGGAEDGV